MLFLLFLSLASADPILHTIYGDVKGFNYKTTAGTIAEIFLNIPYAKPPVGEMRFEKPVKPDPWSELLDGTKFGFCCPPNIRPAILPPKRFNNISEDCLTLNVIRPAKPPPPEGYPVLFWIHGGGFRIGSATIFGYKGFANIYTPEDVVVVTIQYRLGFLGYLAIPEEGIRGNFGLFDMAMALEFVHDNAKTLGINPKKVTAWGLSAGGSAVGQLGVSPYTRDLISGTIEMSGSATTSFALIHRLVEHSVQLSKDLKCTNDVAMCLKGKSLDELYDVVESTNPTPYSIAQSKTGPYVDGDFLPKSPGELLKESPRHPAMIGVSNKDGAYFTYMAYSRHIQHYFVPPEEHRTFGRDQLAYLLKNEFVDAEFYGDNHTAAVDKIIEFYADRRYKEGYGPEFFLDEWGRVISDTCFFLPAAEFAAHKRDLGYPVYLYSFDHYNEAIFPQGTHERLKGSPHVNEYPYLFEVFIMGDYDMNTPEEKLVKSLTTQSIISFAKTGKPVNSHVEWHPLSEKAPMDFLTISSHPKMERDFFKESVDFWHSMRDEYGFDLINIRPHPPSSYSKDNHQEL